MDIATTTTASAIIGASLTLTLSVVITLFICENGVPRGNCLEPWIYLVYFVFSLQTWFAYLIAIARAASRRIQTLTFKIMIVNGLILWVAGFILVIFPNWGIYIFKNTAADVAWANDCTSNLRFNALLFGYLFACIFLPVVVRLVRFLVRPRRQNQNDDDNNNNVDDENNNYNPVPNLEGGQFPTVPE